MKFLPQSFHTVKPDPTLSHSGFIFRLKHEVSNHNQFHEQFLTVAPYVLTAKSPCLFFQFQYYLLHQIVLFCQHQAETSGTLTNIFDSVNGIYDIKLLYFFRICDKKALRYLVHTGLAQMTETRN